MHNTKFRLACASLSLNFLTTSIPACTCQWHPGSHSSRTKEQGQLLEGCTAIMDRRKRSLDNYNELSPNQEDHTCSECKHSEHVATKKRALSKQQCTDSSPIVQTTTEAHQAAQLLTSLQEQLESLQSGGESSAKVSTWLVCMHTAGLHASMSSMPHALA